MYYTKEQRIRQFRKRKGLPASLSPQEAFSTIALAFCLVLLPVVAWQFISAKHEVSSYQVAHAEVQQ